MAVLTAGSKIGFGDGGDPTEVFNIINGVTSLATPEGTKSSIDVTDLSSTAKEYLTGLPDNGTLSLEGFWDESDVTHLAIRAGYIAGTTHNFVIEIAGGTAVAFAASIETFGITSEPDAAVGFTIGLKVTGAVDFSTSDTVTG